MRLLPTVLMASALLAQSAVANTELISKAPEGAKVYIVSPADGDTVSSTFTVVFGLSGMGVAPAGVD